jgi:LPXTG-site transpeptidase (sortase) family protein
MTRTKLQLIIGSALIIIGAVVIIGVIRSQRTSLVTPGPLSASVLQSEKPAVPTVGIHGYPSQLIIPSLNMNLTVIPGIYNSKTKTWTLSLSEVQYAVITPEPNTVSGNTFIYGHYRRAVFASLHTIQLGAQAVIKTTNDHTFYYQLVSEKVTNPNDVSLFSYKGKPILTVQTCTGLFFQNRQLFTFELVRAV